MSQAQRAQNFLLLSVAAILFFVVLIWYEVHTYERPHMDTLETLVGSEWVITERNSGQNDIDFSRAHIRRVLDAGGEAGD